MLEKIKGSFKVAVNKFKEAPNKYFCCFNAIVSVLNLAVGNFVVAVLLACLALCEYDLYTLKK